MREKPQSERIILELTLGSQLSFSFPIPSFMPLTLSHISLHWWQTALSLQTAELFSWETIEVICSGSGAVLSWQSACLSCMKPCFQASYCINQAWCACLESWRRRCRIQGHPLLQSKLEANLSYMRLSNRKVSDRAGEMAGWLRSFVALAEDMGLIPSTSKSGSHHL